MNRLTRLIAIVFSGLLLIAFAPAEAASSFGRTTAGTTPSGGLRADFKRGSKFVLTERAGLQQICAYLDTKGATTGTQPLRFAMYRDQNGVPGRKVAETGVQYLGASQDAPSWQCLGSTRAVLEPGAYWLMIHTGAVGGVVRYYYDGAANWYGNADIWVDDSADPFGAGGTGEGTISIRADYAPIKSAGATTIGTRVSSPMSAQMKRGSSFVLTDKADVWRLNAYIDGQGGAGGSQPLWIALYDDLNGEPGALITKTQVDPGPAGSAGHWVSGEVSGGGNYAYLPVLLMPGRYWIVLHTGAPAGVLRYYMTGTGNWRGNANPGAEPSPFFGPANPGDGTITANISYTVEDVLHHTMGTTTPGTSPSGPMSADYIRGAGVGPEHKFYDAWLTGLWAYVDGNGGTAGAQKVRLAFYYTDYPDHFTSNLVVTSDEVTIPAGKPAGWVRFPVPYTYIRYDSIYSSAHIMMLSGGTQGVARYYSSNDGGWQGGPSPYSSTAPSELNFQDPFYPYGTIVYGGSGSVAAYAEYVNTVATDSSP